MTGWVMWAASSLATGSATGPQGGPVPAELAREVSSVLVIVAILVVVLLGLAAVALVLMMGGRLRRRVQDGLPHGESPPDPMWPLQVPVDGEENRGDD